MSATTKRSAAALLLASLLPRCTTAVDEPALLALRTPPLDGARGDEIRHAPAPTATSATATRERIDLAQAIEQARATRPELAVARAAIEAAQARRGGSGRFPNPRLVARAEAAPFEGRTLDDADLIAGVSQPLPLSDRRAAEQGLADAEFERAQAQLATAEATLDREVRRAFATALFAQHAARQQQTLAEQSEALRQPIEARAVAGDATASERAHAAIAARETAAAARIAQRVDELARADLAAAIGAPDTSIGEVDGELDRVLALPELAEQSARLADHPALRLARAEAGVANAALALAREARIPDLDLDLLYRRIGADEIHAFDVGLSIPLRLFDSGRAAVEVAEAEQRGARAHAVATERDLTASLRQRHARLATALERRSGLQHDLLPLHDELVRIEAARVAAGDARPESLLLAQRARTQAEIELLIATREALDAWAELAALSR